MLHIHHEDSCIAELIVPHQRSGPAESSRKVLCARQAGRQAGSIHYRSRSQHGFLVHVPCAFRAPLLLKSSRYSTPYPSGRNIRIRIRCAVPAVLAGYARYILVSSVIQVSWIRMRTPDWASFFVYHVYSTDLPCGLKKGGEGKGKSPCSFGFSIAEDESWGG